MKIIKPLLLILGISVSSVHADTLNFPQTGFSIDGLEASPSNSGRQVLHMFLPVENGFSANVNVMIQPYSGTIKQYKELSESQFKRVGWKVHSVQENADNITFEYTGVFQRNALHWYAKAFKQGVLVYLVTATDSQSTWNKNKDKLITVVDSFKLK